MVCGKESGCDDEFFHAPIPIHPSPFLIRGCCLCEEQFLIGRCYLGDQGWSKRVLAFQGSWIRANNGLIKLEENEILTNHNRRHDFSGMF